MENVSIRKATNTDVEELLKLRTLLQQHSEESNPSVWHITEEGKAQLRQKVEDAVTDSQSCVLIAESEEQTVGYIHGKVEQRADYLPKTVGTISTVYVIPKFRRKGIGTSLIRQLCEFLASQNVEQVTLRYIIGNKEGEKFWKKLGFKPLITSAQTKLEDLKSKTSNT